MQLIICVCQMNHFPCSHRLEPRCIAFSAYQCTRVSEDTALMRTHFVRAHLMKSDFRHFNSHFFHLIKLYHIIDFNVNNQIQCHFTSETCYSIILCHKFVKNVIQEHDMQQIMCVCLKNHFPLLLAPSRSLSSVLSG